MTLKLVNTQGLKVDVEEALREAVTEAVDYALDQVLARTVENAVALKKSDAIKLIKEWIDKHEIDAEDLGFSGITDMDLNTAVETLGDYHGFQDVLEAVAGEIGWTEVGEATLANDGIDKEDVAKDFIVELGPMLAAEKLVAYFTPGDVLDGMAGAFGGWQNLVEAIPEGHRPKAAPAKSIVIGNLEWSITVEDGAINFKAVPVKS